MRVVGKCSECGNDLAEYGMGPVYSDWHKKYVCSECAYCDCHDERQKANCSEFMRQYAEDMAVDVAMDR